MLQSSQQLTFIDNFLPDYDQAQLSTHAGHSLMVSGEGVYCQFLLNMMKGTLFHAINLISRQFDV